MSTSTLTIVTCSYGPDAARCARLCASIDRFVPGHIEHLLVVPRRDASQFQRLTSHRRKLIVTEDLVPGNFRQVPLLDRWWLDSKGWPVRGWIMQQVTKLSVDRAVDTDNILFADSDVQLIRSLGHAALLDNDKLRLHRVPGAANTGRHLAWHQRAARLLGLEPGYLGSDYIGQLITWKRGNLSSLHSAMEERHGRPWQELVARSTHFSEYILYGAYVEFVLGLENSGHFACADDVCHCCWFNDQADELDDSAATISDRAVAILLQSNLKLSHERENHLLNLANQHVNTRSIWGSTS